jgi:hypothetical protein
MAVRSRVLASCTCAAVLALGACASPPQEPPPLEAVTIPDEPQAAPQAGSQEPDDGYFDISSYLDSAIGVIPVVMPITEPAIGYGLGGALAYFHTRPQVLQTKDGPRIVPPNLTIVGGLATDNGTWAGFVGHLHTWDEGRVRYRVAGGYGALNLDWFGQGDAFGGKAFSYNLDLWGITQKLTMKIGESDFFWGVQQRYAATHTHFDTVPGLPPPGSGLGINAGELEAAVSGVGLVGAYDTRDSLFSPTQGHKLNLTLMRNDESFGSDFNYQNSELEDCYYIPLGGAFVLGLRGDAQFIGPNAPFFDLASVTLRGIPSGRYVDNAAVTLESELRWDLNRRWTMVGFGGMGSVADDVGGLAAADNHWAGGTGFRYLFAKEYDLRLGVDVARGPEEWVLYVTIGTGWLRD